MLESPAPRHVFYDGDESERVVYVRGVRRKPAATFTEEIL